LEENPEEIEFGLSLRRSLRKRPQWNLLEHWRSGMGMGI
jgi:hypothetical protein